MNTVVELEVVVHMFIQDGTSGKYKSKLFWTYPIA